MIDVKTTGLTAYPEVVLHTLKLGSNQVIYVFWDGSTCSLTSADLDHLWSEEVNPTSLSPVQVISRVLKAISKFGCRSGCVWMIESERLFVGALGKSQAWLGRQDKLGKIAGGSATPRVLSGQLLVGDRVFLTLHPITLAQKQQLSQWETGRSIITQPLLEVLVKEEPQLAVSSTRKQSFFPSWIKRPSPIKITPKLSYERRQKFGFLIFLGLTLLLSISVGLGWRARKLQDYRKEYQQYLAAITDLETRASQEVSLNKLVAAKSLQDALTIINQALPRYKPESVEYREILAKQTAITQKYQSYAGEAPTELQLYLDMGLVSPDFFGNQATILEQDLYVLDTNRGVLFRVGTENKRAEPVSGGGSLAGVKAIGAGESVLFGLSSSGLISIEPETGAVTTLALENISQWQSVSLVGGFGSNAYVLDSSAGEIWRYKSNDQAWVQQRWLGVGVKPDFSDVVDLKIDGDIWVLGKQQGLRQYTAGVGRQFELTGLQPALQEPVAVYVTDKVYILDRSAKRVIVYDKAGEYLKQLKWSQDELISDMVVVDNTIFLIAGSKIYQLRD